MKFHLDEKQKPLILFALILIFAIAFRLVSWPTTISQINVDEAMTALNAKTMAETGKDMYGTSFPVYLEAWSWAGQSVVLMYLMAFFIKLFGFSMLTIRLPMLCISIVSIIVFYDFIKRIFHNQKLALWAMFFVSICPWHFLQSIWSIDCNMFPHFMLISVYFLYRGITDKKWLLYLSMFFFAVTMYTYGVSIYIVPFFLLICAIYLMVKKQVTIKELIICISIYLLFSAPIFTMYVINALQIKTNISIGPITIQYFKNSVRTKDMLIFSDDFGATLLANLKSMSKVFLIQYDGLEWNSTKPFGTTYHLSLVFFLIGLLHSIIHKEEKNTATFLFTVWLALSFLVGIFINKTNINRLNVIWFPTLFFSFYGIYVFYKKLKEKNWIKYSIVTVYFVMFIAFFIFLHAVHIQNIEMSYCFAGKTTDAIHYATATLDKHVIFYTNSSAWVYLRIQDEFDNTSSEHINNLSQFEERLKNKSETEAFIITAKDLENSSINKDDYQFERFGNTFVIF